MGFEKFNKNGKIIKVPKISLLARSRISFNVAAVQKYKITQKYAEVYFAKKNNMIGITLTNNNIKDNYNLIYHYSSVSFAASFFLQTCGFIYNGPKQYNINYNQDDKMFIIDLNKIGNKK